MKGWSICFFSTCFTAMSMFGNVSAEQQRPVIYQVLPRLFGNTNETRKLNGTMQQNGCGKFRDFSDSVLKELREFGYTHLWLTGVLEQASGTSYPSRPADVPDLLKGIAGSPYAVKDYFDVCPDYAVQPENRLDEFRALLQRCKDNQLKVIIDFIPNHVARSYASDIRPELSFGELDDTAVFFDRDNNFYYVQKDQDPGGPPLRLPTAGKPGCTGLFAPETDFVRVTGNNAITFTPSEHDWYETVKLNYGHDFTIGRDTSHLPKPDAAVTTVPATWRIMDEVLAYWQEMGVTGFRVDMAHMIPMEFWRWAIPRARERDAAMYLFGEAYDNDPAKLTDGNVLDELLDAGFDAVYDDPVYKIAKGLYDGYEGSMKWANDFDPLTFHETRFHRSLRYAENHDEVRLASPKEWGGNGMAVGRPVSTVIYGMGRGPILLYSGQEVGEPALGAEGFGGDDARTSIFDYWSMPEFQKWVNQGKFDGGRLSKEQKELRLWYKRLFVILRQDAFTKGEFYGLNYANRDNESYGRLHGETASGHWLYSYLRYLENGGKRRAFIVIANFNPKEKMQSVRIQIPKDALEKMQMGEDVHFIERLGSPWEKKIAASELDNQGLLLPELPPLSGSIIELK